MKLYVYNVLRIAREELGYLEKASNYDLDSKTGNPGTNNYTKYARDLWECVPHFYQGSKQGYEWCCVFVDWCIYKACGSNSTLAQKSKFYTGPYGAGCQYAAMYYQSANAWQCDPLPGDQVFFGKQGSYQHTGLVEKVDENTITVIEGNSNNCVRRCVYSINDYSILGYGRPDYSGDAPEDNPFVDVRSDAWYYDAVMWGYANGVVSGVDSTHFDPDKPATRAEVIQMIYKAKQ